MTTAGRSERASSFGRGAAVYHAARPGYPDDAVRWCVPPEVHRVLDLAAGTGKLTAVLVALGLDVVAVEPSDPMRAELARALPSVEARAGTAEDTGLPDASVDAVTVAQAWHWFDPPTAAAEVARVLRPHGTLAVLWNVRDEEVDWVAQYSEIVHRGDTVPMHYVEPALGDAFTAPEHATFRWEQPLTPSGLRDLAASRSHLLTLPADVRDGLLDDVDRLTSTHPDLRGRDRFVLPYRVECWRAVAL